MILGASTYGSVVYGGNLSDGHTVKYAKDNFQVTGGVNNLRSFGDGNTLRTDGNSGPNLSQTSGEF